MELLMRIPDILPFLVNYQIPRLIYPLQSISLLRIWVNLTDDPSLLITYIQWSISGSASEHPEHTVR